jgi:hypothetical protein
MRVKLVRKFANRLNGIDLTGFNVGHVIDVKPHEAALLVAEGWAVIEAPPGGREVRNSEQSNEDSQ